MKTIEEKAKAYDDAFERAKQIRNGNPSSGTAIVVCEEIFPELAESEDERMLKEFNDYLCEEIEARTNDIRDEKDRRTLNMLCYILTKVKDWLEKQKEQKFIDYPHVPGWRKNRDGNKPALKHSVLMLTTHGVAEGEWLGEKWCQYRWSCELKDNEILYWIHLSDLTQLEKEDEIIEKEQKPAEWKLPDDFEEAVYKVANFISPFNSQEELRKVSHRFAEQLLDMAKKEQKPAEWSEEDETKLNDVIRIIENHCGLVESIRNHYVKFLKRLRPSWKPSEEQEEPEYYQHFDPDC